MTENQDPNSSSPFKGKTGLRRIINACSFSKDGFKAAFKDEQAFRQLVYLNFVLIILAFVFDFTVLSKLLLIVTSFATLIIELINTAIEAAIDHTSLERHPLAKKAKDAGSAAQTLGLTVLIIVWITLLIQDKPWGSLF